MMRLVPIASSSSGNCTYIGSEHTHILLDAGISFKRIRESLGLLGLSQRDIGAVLLTHEHGDHIKGLGTLLRRLHIPVYASGGTIEALSDGQLLGAVDPELLKKIPEGESFFVGDLKILPFAVSHDAAEPIAYRIEEGEKSLAVVTDLGIFDADIVRHLKGLDAILLEANHDVRMLEAGPYPYALKRRILGSLGHLSNENAGRLLGEILHDNMKQIYLGHLSRHNNDEALACLTVRTEIDLGENPYRASDFEIRVAQKDKMSETVWI